MTRQPHSTRPSPRSGWPGARRELHPPARGAELQVPALEQDGHGFRFGVFPQGPWVLAADAASAWAGPGGKLFHGHVQGRSACTLPSVSLSLVNCAWVSHSGTHNGISPELMQGGAPVAVFAPYGGSRLCTLTSVCLSSGLARFGRGL